MAGVTPLMAHCQNQHISAGRGADWMDLKKTFMNVKVKDEPNSSSWKSPIKAAQSFNNTITYPNGPADESDGG